MKNIILLTLVTLLIPTFAQDKKYREEKTIEKEGDNGKVEWKEKLIAEKAYTLQLACKNGTGMPFKKGTAKGIQDDKDWDVIDNDTAAHFRYKGFKPKEDAFKKNELTKVYKPLFSGEFEVEGDEPGKPPVWNLSGEETAIIANIDVDYNRDGKVTIEEDNVDEEADKVTYPGEKGALVVVNVDDDEGDQKPDCLDSTYSDKDNDLSDIVLELGDNIKSLHNNEKIKVVLVAKPIAVEHEGQDAKPRFRVFDDKKKELFVLKKEKIEKDVSEFFKDEKKRTFKIEGLQFARGIHLIFEVREGDSVLTSDEIKMRSTSYIVNYNKQKEIQTVGSKRFPFLKKPGIIADVFCQDGAEYGFQATFINGVQKNMIIDLGIIRSSGGFNELKIKDNVGFYDSNNEDYEKHNNNGDMGGNLECLPVGDNGTIFVGNSMSKKFGFFLLRQGVQKLAIIPIKNLNLAHIDEVAYVKGDTIYQVSYSLGKQIMDNYKSAKVELINDVLSQFSPNAGTAFFKHIEHNTGIDLSKNIVDGKIKIHLTKAVDNAIKATGMKVVYVPQLHYMKRNNPNIAQHSFSFPSGIANAAFREGVTYVNSKTNNLHNGKYKQDFLKDWKVKIPGIKFKAVRAAWFEGGETHCASNGIHEPFKVK